MNEVADDVTEHLLRLRLRLHHRRHLQVPQAQLPDPLRHQLQLQQRRLRQESQLYRQARLAEW